MSVRPLLGLEARIGYFFKFFFKVGAVHSNPGPCAHVAIALHPSSRCKILKYGLQVGKHLIFIYLLADERDEELWGI